MKQELIFGTFSYEIICILRMLRVEEGAVPDVGLLFGIRKL